jgi:hypothetical protein
MIRRWIWSGEVREGVPEANGGGNRPRKQGEGACADVAIDLAQEPGAPTSATKAVRASVTLVDRCDYCAKVHSVLHIQALRL